MILHRARLLTAGGCLLIDSLLVLGLGGLPAAADDTGWLQAGVRAWYAGISASGSTSDAEEAYLIQSLQNGAAHIVKHAAISFWTSPQPVQEVDNPNAASDGEFWISPARLRAMQPPAAVSWRGLSCLVKAHDTWKLSDNKLMHLLPIVALFELQPQREIVVLTSQAGALADYYFDVETGLMLYSRRTIGGYDLHLTLAEINYDFATHQAFAEDRGPHAHFRSWYYVGSTDATFRLETFQLNPICVGRYGSRVLWRHSGSFGDTSHFASRPFDGEALYDAGTGQCFYNPDYTFFTDNWTPHGNHFFAWIPPAHLANNAIQLQYSTLLRQGGTADGGALFSTTVMPADFDVVTAVYDADGFAIELVVAATNYQYYVDSRTATVLHQVRVDGRDYFLQTMAPNLAGLWAGATDLGGGWKRLGWLGDFVDAGGGWIWHGEHGWLYCVGTSTSNLWLWSSRLGWLWTSDSVYAFLWSDTAHAWFWYYRGTGNGAGGWFYDYGTGQAEWK